MRSAKFVQYVALAVLFVSMVKADDGLLNGYVNQKDLAGISQRLREGEAATTAAFTELIRKADVALVHKSRAVPVFNVPAFYGDEQTEHSRLKNLLSDDSAAAFCLALAAVLTKDPQDKQRYADHAAKILDDWASTNIDVAGADGNLVMCYNGTAFVFAADALDLTDRWNNDQEVRFRKWVCEVLLPAAKIKKRQNNWACWGIMASLTANRLLGDATGFDADVMRLRDIIDQQIAPDGSMPHEIKRGKRSLWYTYFALAPMTVAVELVRDNGRADLFGYDPPSGGTIAQAIAFFYECGIANQRRWPVPIDEEVARAGKYATLLFSMGTVYNNDVWKDFAVHPLWRDRGGLAWICPSLLPPGSRQRNGELRDVNPQNRHSVDSSAD